MITLIKLARTPGDEAYRILLGHTYGCASCRLAPCPTAVRLSQAWRDERR